MAIYIKNFKNSIPQICCHFCRMSLISLIEINWGGLVLPLFHFYAFQNKLNHLDKKSDRSHLVIHSKKAPRESYCLLKCTYLFHEEPVWLGQTNPNSNKLDHTYWLFQSSHTRNSVYLLPVLHFFIVYSFLWFDRILHQLSLDHFFNSSIDWMECLKVINWCLDSDSASSQLFVTSI